MASNDELRIRVLSVPDGDAEELANLTNQLRNEILKLDVAAVTLLFDHEAPEHAKGLGAAGGWLAVQAGTPEMLRAVCRAVSDWCIRSGRTIEVTCGNEMLKLTRATPRQQEQIIDAWLARHTPSV